MRTRREFCSCGELAAVKADGTTDCCSYICAKANDHNQVMGTTELIKVHTQPNQHSSNSDMEASKARNGTRP